MRKVMSVFALCGAAVLSASCASGGMAPSAAPAAGTSVTAPATAPSGSPADPTSPSPTGAAATTGASANTPTTKPGSPHSTTLSTAAAKATTTTGAPTSFGYSRTANAQAQIDAARAAAKADGKEVLLDFGATWCGNCVAMEAAFKSPQGKAELAASYHLVQVDVGDNVDANMRILMGYDSSGGYGLPVLIILSPSGSIRVDTNKTGNPGFDQGSFVAFLKKWAA